MLTLQNFFPVAKLLPKEEHPDIFSNYALWSAAQPQKKVFPALYVDATTPYVYVYTHTQTHKHTYILTS
jgi:hypothetical protein